MQTELQQTVDALEQSCRTIMRNAELREKQYDYINRMLKEVNTRLMALIKAQDEQQRSFDSNSDKLS